MATETIIVTRTVFLVERSPSCLSGDNVAQSHRWRTGITTSDVPLEFMNGLPSKQENSQIVGLRTPMRRTIFLGKTPKAFCPYVMTGVRRRRRCRRRRRRR